MQKSYYPKADEINQEWVLVDANGQFLGRIATKIASLLLGKHKPDFTPGVQTGDNVIVINASNIRVTGKKLEEKTYYHHTGHPGGIKAITLLQQLEKHPDRVIRAAVWGMLPHNKVGRQLVKNLRVYGGAEHPHAAQNPKTIS